MTSLTLDLGYLRVLRVPVVNKRRFYENSAIPPDSRFLCVLPPSLKLWWTGCLPAIAHPCERRLVISVVKNTAYNGTAFPLMEKGSRLAPPFTRIDNG